MKSGWVDSEAQAAIDRYAAQGVGRDLAARVYTTRLLGRDPRLVLHGGGNTSVKTTMRDLLGEEVAVLCVKGSGADMAVIEPAGLPAVRLERLRKLRARAELSDEDMVRVQRENLLEPAAPNPSVETLLHAFLPHRFVDHTHANAILSLVDQPDGEAICAELYDGRMSVVPYVMPGFALAKMAADVFDAKPDVDGLILHKHGIFTFGDSAREAYERMIALVTLAEERLARNRKAVFVTAQLPQAIAPVGAVAPILRGACSRKDTNDRGRMAAPDPRLPHRPRDHEFRRRRRHRPLQPGGRRDARSHHPHQELAAGGSPRPRTARWMTSSAPRTRRCNGVHRALRDLFRAPECARRRHQEGARSAAARRARPRPRAVRPRAIEERRTDRSRPGAMRDRGDRGRRGDRPLRIDLGSRDVRHGILVARTGEAQRRGGKAARRPDRGHHRRRRHHRRGHRQGIRERRERRSLCSISTKARRRRKQKSSAARRWR